MSNPFHWRTGAASCMSTPTQLRHARDRIEADVAKTRRIQRGRAI